MVTIVAACLGFSYVFLGEERFRAVVFLGLIGCAAVGFGMALLYNLIWPGPPEARRMARDGYSFEEENGILALYGSQKPNWQQDAFVVVSLLLTIIGAVSAAFVCFSPTASVTSWLVFVPVASLWLVAGVVAFYAKYRTDRPRFK